jgi:hypothetical protein
VDKIELHCRVKGFDLHNELETLHVELLVAELLNENERATEREKSQERKQTLRKPQQSGLVTIGAISS